VTADGHVTGDGPDMVECAPADLGPALAARVAGDLRAAIASGRRASIAVPGGSTPAPFLAALAGEALDWSRVTVTLTDERCVPVDDPRSNQGLVRRHLLQGAAGQARFVPLHGADLSVTDAEQAFREKLLPLHVCVLGMGDDMHTASLFPGTPGLDRVLDPACAQLVARVSPPGAQEERVTLTARALLSAAHTYLLIRGAAKRRALDQAMQTTDRLSAPIRVIVDAARAPRVFYAA